MTTTEKKPEPEISAALEDYCRAFDEARFEAFAALFQRGRWFMVTEDGSRPVLEWIEQHVVLYDGRPMTHHEIDGLVVSTASDTREAAFQCGIVITQRLPGEAERLLARARFSGTFRRHDDGWWWHQHTMDPQQTGDLSTHIRGGPSHDVL